MKRALVALLVVGCSVLAGDRDMARAATSFCAETPDFLRSLDQDHGEVVVARWADAGGMRMLSINVETRAWTLSNVDSKGQACTMRTGYGYWVVGFEEGDPA